MEDPVRVDLVFPRSGQRLEVFVPLGTAVASEEKAGLRAVCDARLRPDLKVPEAEKQEPQH